MGNYFAQIAARNAVNDRPMLVPAHSPIELALDDPFDRSTFDAGATIQPGEDSRSASSIFSPAGKDMPVQPVKDKTTALQASPIIKPVYLSKFIERNQHSGKDASYPPTTKPQPDTDGGGAALERKSPLAPETINPSAKTAAAKQETGKETIKPVQQQGIEGEGSQKQPVILLQPIEPIKEKTSLTPTVAATKATTGAVFLQPPAPMESPAPLQKEKALPTLVIGKITVEIVPAQKPVNKIINQVIKSQPSTTPTPRSKFGFGLGQL